MLKVTLTAVQQLRRITEDLQYNCSHLTFRMQLEQQRQQQQQQSSPHF